MDVPKYLQVLWQYKWLLLVGLALAVVAGLLSAYSFDFGSGTLTSRATYTYTAQANVLVTSPNQKLFQSEIPGQTVKEGETQPVAKDLSQTAVIYAYLISGTETRKEVAKLIGPLSPDESITALRRTTQPGGDESFPGRLTLPVLAVIGTASDPDRAVLIATTATEVFQKEALAQQESDNIPANLRVDFENLDTPTAVQSDGSNPIIPITVTALGVFLIFVALSFVLYNVKLNRAVRPSRHDRKAARSGSGPSVERGPEVATYAQTADHASTERQPVSAGHN